MRRAKHFFAFALVLTKKKRGKKERDLLRRAKHFFLHLKREKKREEKERNKREIREEKERKKRETREEKERKKRKTREISGAEHRTFLHLHLCLKKQRRGKKKRERPLAQSIALFSFALVLDHAVLERVGEARGLGC